MQGQHKRSKLVKIYHKSHPKKEIFQWYEKPIRNFSRGFREKF